MKPAALHHTRFKTILGICSIGWKGDAIQALQLAGGRIKGRRGVAPVWVKQVIRKIQRHLEGSPQNFSDVVLDLTILPPFYRRTLTKARRIPSGHVVSYGALAKKIGSPKAARAVGQALAKNPIPILIPCHRIVAAGNRLGGFSGRGGVKTKLKLLAIEGFTTGCGGGCACHEMAQP